MNQPGPHYNQPQQPQQGYNQQPTAEQQPGSHVPMIGAAAIGGQVERPATSNLSTPVGIGPNGESLYRNPDGTITSVENQPVIPNAPSAGADFINQVNSQPAPESGYPAPYAQHNTWAQPAPQSGTEQSTEGYSFGPQGTPPPEAPGYQQLPTGQTAARAANEEATTQVSGGDIAGLAPPQMQSKRGEEWSRQRPAGRRPRWQQPIHEE